MSSSFYELLQVSPTAKRSAILKAYQSLLFQLHPDKSNNKDYAQVEIVVNAWRCLGNDEKRQLYNRQLVMLNSMALSKDDLEDDYRVELISWNDLLLQSPEKGEELTWTCKGCGSLYEIPANDIDLTKSQTFPCDGCSLHLLCKAIIF